MRLQTSLLLLLGQLALGTVILQSSGPENLSERDALTAPEDIRVPAVNNIQARAWSTASLSTLLQQIRLKGATSYQYSVFYNGFKDIRGGLPDAYYMHWASPGTENKDQQDLRIAALSAAFARGSTGTAYVVIPKGTQLYSGPSTWNDFELPNLTDNHLNPYMHDIVVVKYDSSKSAQQMKMTTLWKMGQPRMGTWPPRVESRFAYIFD